MELSGSISEDDRKRRGGENILRKRMLIHGVHQDMEKKKTSPDEQIQSLRVMFESVEQMLICEDYYKDLQQELSAACPEYMTVLLTAKRDLLRNDCGIVVTGETSAGKTTLINQLVGERVFSTNTLAATGRITRVRHSEKMEVKCYTKNDTLKKTVEVQDVKKMRSVIRKLTDISKIPEELKDIYYVDVYLPVSILKGNVIIVDTPGIGENEGLDKMLLDFLPHAVSFVFIANARNAGGIHDDRLSKILKTILDNRHKMPCFDPKEVMFLTNQWDIIKNVEYSTDEDENGVSSKREDQHTQIWIDIQDKLSKGWAGLQIENIFRISLEQVANRDDTFFTDEYKRFEIMLKETIENNENKRVEYYYRFLRNFIPHAERGTLARLKLLERSEEEQQLIIDKSNVKIEEFERNCKESKTELESYRGTIVSKLAESLHDYVHSDKGRKEILNPNGKVEISKVSYTSLGDEVSSRFESGLKRWCEGTEVKAIFEEADKKIKSHVKDIESKLKEIEIEITGIDTRVGNPDDAFYGINVGVLFVHLAIVFSFLFALVFVPIYYVYGFVIGVRGRIRKADDLYNECLAKITMSELKASFESSFGKEYDKILASIFNEALPKVIESLRATNKKLLADHIAIKQKHESFMRLKEKIRQIQIATDNFEILRNC